MLLMSPRNRLFLAVLFEHIGRSAVAGRKCFSCMSRYYGVTWDFVGYSRLYLEPRTFTDQCSDPTIYDNVPTVNCPDSTNCVALVEDLRIASICPNYPPWRSWSDSSCLWSSANEMQAHLLAKCHVSLGSTILPELPFSGHLPSSPCGHCSFKIRCRNRGQFDSCFPLEVEKQICHEHGDTCTFPKIEINNIGCNYWMGKTYFTQCLNRPDLPPWEADGYRKLHALVADVNCIDKDGQCKCCCHPYRPSADGAICEEQITPQCDPFNEWNDWSQCMWIPLGNLSKQVSEHCSLRTSKNQQTMLGNFRIQGDGDTPEKCGYCSFKLKCRKRSLRDIDNKKQCFPIEAEKQACGSDDCDTCAQVCTLPKLIESNSCAYSNKFNKVLAPIVKLVGRKLNYHLRHGMDKLLGIFPQLLCVEKDNMCKCCCHPYQPNAEGTECQLNPVCKTLREHGIEIDKEPSLFF